MTEKRLTAVLIDDEKNAISNLSRLLEMYCKGVVIVGSAENATEGIQMIHQQHPDMVFLDIEMPGGNGFDMLECFTERDFDVIFVTSYNQHAIKAFKYSAVDYLLKPVDIDLLIQAIERIRQRKPQYRNSDSLSGLFQNLQSLLPCKLGIATLEGKEYLEIEDIVRVEADGSYSVIFLKNGSKHLVSRNIGEYEILLQDQSFLRVHNSHLINIRYVSRYTKQDGGWIILNDHSEIPVSRRRKEIFETLMRKISRE